MLRERLGEEQLGLLELLARAASLLPQRTPFVAPNRTFFPNEYEPTLVSAADILQRLLAYAGLGEFSLEIEDTRRFEEPSLEELEVQHPDVWFIEASGKQLRFQIDRLGPGDVTVATLAQEVARAALALKASRTTRSPRRRPSGSASVCSRCFEKLKLPYPFQLPREIPAVKPLDHAQLERLERSRKPNGGQVVERKWERKSLSYPTLGRTLSNRASIQRPSFLKLPRSRARARSSTVGRHRRCSANFEPLLI